MSIKLRLIIMNFLQFFIWGAWLISFGSYVGNVLHFDGVQIGSFFAIMGIASLFMPALVGIIADRWVPAQKLYGICHLLGAVFLLAASFQTDYAPLYVLMLLSVMVYMPTLALSYTVAYNALAKENKDVVKDFPPIRVWGTIGFICAMWTVDLTGFKISEVQLYVSAISSLILGIYSFFLPACEVNKNPESKSLVDVLGLRAFTLFKDKQMAVFFLFSMLLGAALQITNGFGDLFLSSFAAIPEYAHSFGVEHSVILLSVSQISETLFILTIPFFLNRFGIKKVMLLSMFAWVLRFGLFGLGNPGSGLPLLILSMIVYGMAFDFFNISGSLYVEQTTDSKIRASAQGLFMLMTNGVGAIIGSYAAGAIVNHYVTQSETPNWPMAWYIFAAYALIIGILFAFCFKTPKKQ
ncbi:xanthosine permease [Bacteroidia bacterium]|nr:xanthosine permease [Bacteroidia bacterium]